MKLHSYHGSIGWTDSIKDLKSTQQGSNCCVMLKRIKIKYSVKPVLSGHSKRIPKISFQYRLLLNAGQKYCRMLPLEHSAILSTLIKLPFSNKTFVLSIFKWPL